MITNPGGSFPSRSYWTELWQGVVLPMPPKPVGNYDALELRLDKRFTSEYPFSASYTLSRLYGNYSGLASADEADAYGNGRNSPNVNRYYDMPWAGIMENGQYAYGRLATGRPHSFKFWGSYTLKSKAGSTTFAPFAQLYSGTPVTTEANLVSSTPAFPYGRGDLGRTPVYFNTDFNVVHDVAPFAKHEEVKVRIDVTAFNLFNSAIATDRYKVMLHRDDGQIQFNTASGDPDYASVFKGFNTKALMAAQGIRQNPLYKMDSVWQGPRSLRLRLSFVF